jgi:hypothetical protein
LSSSEARGHGVGDNVFSFKIHQHVLAPRQHQLAARPDSCPPLPNFYPKQLKAKMGKKLFAQQGRVSGTGGRWFQNNLGRAFKIARFAGFKNSARPRRVNAPEAHKIQDWRLRRIPGLASDNFCHGSARSLINKPHHVCQNLSVRLYAY